MCDHNNTTNNDTMMKLFQVLPIFSKVDNRKQIPILDITKSKLWQKRQNSKKRSEEKIDT